jgi:hypothetical protein
VFNKLLLASEMEMGQTKTNDMPELDASLLLGWPWGSH